MPISGKQESARSCCDQVWILASSAESTQWTGDSGVTLEQRRKQGQPKPGRELRRSLHLTVAYRNGAQSIRSSDGLAPAPLAKMETMLAIFRGRKQTGMRNVELRMCNRSGNAAITAAITNHWVVHFIQLHEYGPRVMPAGSCRTMDLSPATWHCGICMLSFGCGCRVDPCQALPGPFSRLDYENSI